MNRLFACLLLAILMVASQAFTSLPSTSSKIWSTTYAEPKGKGGDPEEIVARRIIVKGDVQGGYYRSCVLNEAGRFRRLIGTMSPPDDTDKAEIYVEGKRKMVEGFVRWCQKGNVGLSQVVGVEEVVEEEPTGLYDGFYVKTK
mmetsp:Transcript_127530/g.366885  ORF Transcript_127530/g.366885 Transcript_127530/m.366885 type:complete len:143 (+) Transcript_127530:109-537(+)